MPAPPTGTKSQPSQVVWNKPGGTGPASDPSAPEKPRSLFREPPAGTVSSIQTKKKPPAPPQEPDEPETIEITDDVGIRLGPLYKDKSADETVMNIFALLNSVGVRNFDIKAIRINVKEGYAKIELPDKAIEEYLLRTLSETCKLQNLFNFSTLTDDFENFRVTRLNNYVGPVVEPPPQKALPLVTRKSSMPSQPPCQCHERLFYEYDEAIGYESRTMEFKCANWNMHYEENIDLVGKYVCAFLNGGGGIMYLGVSDDGKIRGIKCQEEQFLLFQRAISLVPNHIEPPITKDCFVINKIKVRPKPENKEDKKDKSAKEKEEPPQKIPANLCVMEVCIKPIRPAGEHDTPYLYKGRAYWRREASTHQINQR